MKRKGIVITVVVVAVLLAAYGFFKSNYNALVVKNEGVSSAWSNVESQYQRRADLIPNLVNTVKGYAAHEQQTLAEVVEARSKATSFNLNIDDMNAENLKKFNAVQGELSSALSRLVAIGENYPDLKANENFRDLQTQLEGTENRIATERRKYNEVAKDYNVYVRAFPRNIVAKMFGFGSVAYFTAEAGAEKAPEVNF